MKNEKKRKAELLFDAIGRLDDRLLQDALTWRPRNRLAITRALLIAATLSLSAAVMISGVLLALRRDNEPNADFPPDNGTEETNPTVIPLDTALLAVRDHASYATVSTDKISFYDGKARIVWQYADSDTLCVSRELTRQELEVLREELGKGDRVGTDSPALSCTVWVICGDGEVLSPYLEASAGNVGQGELFNYEAELIPSDTLTSCISGILE